ncbi:uncharacterized protein TRAVEDRAFT_46303 [Trametes versicolor FP-101664 SS1]|uniref:uncharacterized protein n=1 Tax=Trametes versicolor (strain FP-101664) TaxID=717944 RepID=UPI0004623A60|nr:uncharacterized protein TRAVEDRAFT_46303 [Trametes versicolor FP-101664 SS1]EIW61079.1 hypothetical protein TRAVEDRAFT_46303 [Trametes versicolor FP-101664 SS1]
MFSFGAMLPDNKPDPSDSEDHCAHASPHHIEKDECVWLPDGDIILLPRNEAIGFCVYREVLERESRVLKDEIARQLPTATTTADGRPAICMPDTTHELQTLLSALFIGKDYYHVADKPSAIWFVYLSALVRMGHKYEIQDLVDEGIARLKKYYPANPTEWEDIRTREKCLETCATAATRVVALALLTDTPTLLPGALLDCCMLATRTQADMFYKNAKGPIHCPELEELPPDMRARVMAGTALLTTARAARTLGVLRAVPCRVCRHPERCALAIQRTLQDIDMGSLREATRVRHWYEPLHGWLWEGREGGEQNLRVG